MMIFCSNINVMISSRCLIIRCISSQCGQPLVYNMFSLRRQEGVCVKTVHSQWESPAARAGSSSDTLLQHASVSSKKFPHIPLPTKTRCGRKPQVFPLKFSPNSKRTRVFCFFFSFIFPRWLKFFFPLFWLEDTWLAWYIHSGSSDDQTLDLARSLQSAGLPAAWHSESLRLRSLRPDTLPPLLPPVLP